MAPVKNAIAGLGGAVTRSFPGDDLFKDLFIPSLEIEIRPEGIAGLRRSARRYVRATIREGAILYTNVAIHLKGGPGSYRQLQDDPAFTLNFDKFAEGQTFHGLKKIHLNNSVQDRSYLSEKISRELFEAAGVPTPRAGNATVRRDREVFGCSNTNPFLVGCKVRRTCRLELSSLMSLQRSARISPRRIPVEAANATTVSRRQRHPRTDTAAPGVTPGGSGCTAAGIVSSQVSRSPVEFIGI